MTAAKRRKGRPMSAWVTITVRLSPAEHHRFRLECDRRLVSGREFAREVIMAAVSAGEREGQK